MDEMEHEMDEMEHAWSMSELCRITLPVTLLICISYKRAYQNWSKYK